MKKLILIVAFALMGCRTPCGTDFTQSDDYLTVDNPTTHDLEIVGEFSCRYPIHLTYSDSIIMDQDRAFNEWLQNISAKEFLEKYCVGYVEPKLLVEKERT